MKSEGGRRERKGRGVGYKKDPSSFLSRAIHAHTDTKRTSFLLVSYEANCSWQSKQARTAAFACSVFPRTHTVSLCFLLLSAKLKLFSSLSGLLLESGSGGIFCCCIVRGRGGGKKEEEEEEEEDC
jgi:hypothetical protein